MIDAEAERYFRREAWNADPHLWEIPTMTKTHDFWVTIHGERGEEWQRVLGTNRLPVQGPIPMRAILPGLGEALVYQVALDQLEHGQQERITTHLCEKFQLAPAEAEAEIRAAGIPILAESCSVMVLSPQRWF